MTKSRKIAAAAVAITIGATALPLGTQAANASTSTARASTVRGAYCTGSESHAKLVRALDKALAGSVGKNQPVRVRVAFRDRSTGVECRLASNSRTYARSTIKVSLVAALL